MGRFNLAVRPVYRDDEPTGGERIQQGLQGGLDWYAARRETARGEANTVGAAGGRKLPDEAKPGIRQRIGGIGQRLGEIVHGRAPGLPDVGGLQPTGPFVARQQGRPGAMPMDEQLDPYGNADDMVTDAIMQGRGGAPNPALGPARMVPPTPPQGALTPSPRMMPGGPRMGVGGMPASPSMSPGMSPSPARTFEYQGSDGARYEMPQTGERERVNRNEELGYQTSLKEGLSKQHEEESISALVNAGMPEDEARARVLTNTVKYDEEYGRRGPLTLDEREKLVRLAASLRSQGRNAEARAIDQKLRERSLDIQAQREGRLAEEGGTRAINQAGQAESRVAATAQRGVITDPLNRKIAERDPAQRAEQAGRRAQVDSANARQSQAAAELRERGTQASKPPKTPDLTSARAERDRLVKKGLSPEQAKAKMKKAGWPIK